jgi:hypothetical protein
VRNRKSHFGSKVKLERSSKDQEFSAGTFAEVEGASASGLVLEPRKGYFLSVARKSKIHNAAKKKGHENT